jgi:hypothetical protein
MPLHWKIDSRERLITVVAEGNVTRSDVDAYLDVLDGAGLSRTASCLTGCTAKRR